MNYQETLNYLYHTLPMFSRVGATAIKKDLHNTIALCNILNQPQQKFLTIHVAGTNGKGSVSHMLAAILQQAGYKTGLYTSPHLYDFRERIKVNGVMMAEEDVVNFTKYIQPHIEIIQPSFFEITVAMAFDYFAKQHVDISVIETGLGGRLDSTNIVNPILSIITNIGYDHVAILGNTIEEIAYEKAGIIKPNTPVVAGKVNTETQTVFETVAASQNARLVIADNEIEITDSQYNEITRSVTIRYKKTGVIASYELDLPGNYQTENLRTVLVAIKLLQLHQGINISETQLKDALLQVKKLTGLYGRWDVLNRDPLTVLDVGHNPDGIQTILAQLAETDFDQLHIVLGMVKDKDIDAVLELLPASPRYYFCNADIPRAMPAEELQQKAALNNLNGLHYNTVMDAFTAAKQQAKASDCILVCGSVFVVAEVNR